jgi:hypothetical protein
MLDPINSLAFSLHSNKGVYAMLLGSGISRAAGIPTGWEITLELVRKVAALQGEDCEPDPAAWYAAKAGKQPDYSDLLDLVAKTPAERQQLLRSYWEPSEEARAEGAKQPTRAHHASLYRPRIDPIPNSGRSKVVGGSASACVIPRCFGHHVASTDRSPKPCGTVRFVLAC